MIIDIHTHVWPDQIAHRALAGNIPQMPLLGDGTVSGLLASQASAGIDLSVCLAVANRPSQVAAANAFAGRLDRTRLVPFGTVHPDLPLEDNLAALERNDIRGVKLHPLFQGFRLDDPRVLAILEALAGRLPVIVHVGAGAGSDGSLCTPGMLAAIARTLPRLTLVACHFGGYLKLAEATEALHGLDIFLDTSWPPTLGTLVSSDVVQLIRRHGVHRVVFASDWPTASQGAEVAVVRQLGLTDEETELVLGANAARILGLGQP